MLGDEGSGYAMGSNLLNACVRAAVSLGGIIYQFRDLMRD
jgi:N-acetylglucosamine kinase-like BadF-type ATPase